MGFIKHASVQSIATASFEENGLRKVAFASNLANDPASEIARTKSYYVDGARKIDVRAMLATAASKYQISEDPKDYIFEAIRANTVNVPNENHDAFHKNELLRFDTRLGMPVYLTYTGKPHHMNHCTNIPERARGVILDAHYNDEAPALANCLTCNHRTAEEDGRDPSGIHCAKCGSIAKDEFIEILVAVDGKKDPRLVREIQAGALNAGSMGCSCSSTACNVCHKVARTTSEFCEHIRGSAKGSLWLKEGNKLSRTSADKVKSMLKSAAYKCAFDGNQLVSVSLVIPERGIEVRKAFEFCQGVEFDEYSRVHRPADPKARSIEILKAASSANIPLSIDQETEQLIIRARLNEAAAKFGSTEASMPKAASSEQKTFFAIRVNGNDEDIHIGDTLKVAAEIAEPGKRDFLEYLEVKAETTKQALTRAIAASLTKSAQYLPMAADVNLVVPDGVKVHLDQGGNTTMTQPGQPGAPGQMPGPGGPQMPGQPGQPQNPSIEDVTQNDMNSGDQQQSPEEFGMLPPGASMDSADGLQMASEGGQKRQPGMPRQSAQEQDMEQKYAQVYGDFEIEVFADKAVVLAPGGDVFSVKASEDLTTDEAKRKFGGQLIDSVLTEGLVRTALKFGGEFNSRIADSTEGAMFDTAGGRPMMSGGSLEGAEFAQKEAPQMGSDIARSPGATKDYDDDMQESRPMPSNSIESRDTDMADEAAVASPKSTSTEGHEEAQKEKRPSYSQKDDSLDGGTTDMKANAGGDSSPKIASKDEVKVAEERVRKLYAARLEKAKADFESEKQAILKAEREKIFRALRIAQRRAALNIEASPLKATVLDSLTVPRSLGRSAATGDNLEYTGLDEGLSLHLVEAAWERSASEEIESLISRTAELLDYDDKYLISAEKDLSKQAAVVPPVVEQQQLQPANDVQRRAAALRADVMDGNMILAPSMTDSSAGEEKLNAIRAALGPTKVSRMLQGAPEEFRPSA